MRELLATHDIVLTQLAIAERVLRLAPSWGRQFRRRPAVDSTKRCGPCDALSFAHYLPGVPKPSADGEPLTEARCLNRVIRDEEQLDRADTGSA